MSETEIDYERYPVDYRTHCGANDDYNIPQFAKDDPRRFLELVEFLSPRDQEILICYALLQKRPTDLSILFGKAGHRAEENLHKAAHKLAGIIEFGCSPSIDRLRTSLSAVSNCRFAGHDLAVAIWQYARSRDFGEMARLIGHPGLRQEMLRTFKKLHATSGRDEGLLAGWLLWLVDGANTQGKGWARNKRRGRYKLGPTVFRTFKHETCVTDKQGREINPRATPNGGRKQVRIQRKLKFLLRGTNG